MTFYFYSLQSKMKCNIEIPRLAGHRRRTFATYPKLAIVDGPLASPRSGVDYTDYSTTREVYKADFGRSAKGFAWPESIR